MSFKLKNVVFDMDGTLLTDSKEVTKLTRQTLEKLRTQNINVILATGRPWFLLIPFMKNSLSNYPAVVNNGCVVYDYKLQKMLHEVKIEQPKAMRILKYVFDNNLAFILYTKEDILYNDFGNEMSLIMQRRKEVRESKKEDIIYKIEKVNDLKELASREIFKIMVTIENFGPQKAKETLQTIKKLLAEESLYMVEAQRHSFDIMNLGVSKHTGLQYLEEDPNYDFKLSETIVFGDSANDEEMCSHAAQCVAMGNAMDLIKKVATYVTKSNEEEGIFDFFKKHYNF